MDPGVQVLPESLALLSQTPTATDPGQALGHRAKWETGDCLWQGGPRVGSPHWPPPASKGLQENCMEPEVKEKIQPPPHTLGPFPPLGLSSR
jgi:hypothetical protein